ncbi:hypothetical protein GOODEAATRI_014297 [Goodea atripinnis]|uniref:Uncharacterized protein n=1 Tax=Goodea atripinnis TaxID=208336 RepID=A0ABV0N1B8_9TELE
MACHNQLLHWGHVAARFISPHQRNSFRSSRKKASTCFPVFLTFAIIFPSNQDLTTSEHLAMGCSTSQLHVPQIQVQGTEHSGLPVFFQSSRFCSLVALNKHSRVLFSIA